MQKHMMILTFLTYREVNKRSILRNGTLAQTRDSLHFFVLDQGLYLVCASEIIKLFVFTGL